MYLPDSSILTNIQVQGHPRLKEILFEKKYILIKSLENRLYTDEELVKLPEISPEHPHYREWMIRKCSAQRLVRHLAARKKTLNILEIGCGNGWLSHQLAEIPGTRVTALDINFTELQQAARIFSNDPNLRFIHGDIHSGILEDRQFDCIIFAATVEFFPSFKKIIHTALSYLKPNGDIHILDSPFCKPEDVETEKRKTLSYYYSFGFPEMADYLYHHSTADLRCFCYEILYRPNSMRNKLSRVRNPFPWVRITAN